MPPSLVHRVVDAYERALARTYCRIRFCILRPRFLDEIERFLPRSGEVVDIGCGFGLFTLYFSQRLPAVRLFGIDLNERRIEQARTAARRLGAANVEFQAIDAQAFLCRGSLAGAYLMDLVHHIPPAAVPKLVSEIVRNLEPGGCLIVKDVDSRPWFKMAFTWLLDKLMDVRAPVRYWSREEMCTMLAECGLRVECRPLSDFLPYPHVLYVGWKDAERVAG